MQDTHELRRSLGLRHGLDAREIESQCERLVQYINLQLIALGQPHAADSSDSQFADIARGLVDQHRAQSRLLSDHRCPADSRVESFLARYFADLHLPQPLRLPDETLVVDRHGTALYFSRADIPYGDAPRLLHIGLYAYTPDALARFVEAGPCALERSERLEQLRLLDLGLRIRVGIVDTPGP